MTESTANVPHDIALNIEQLMEKIDQFNIPSAMSSLVHWNANIHEQVKIISERLRQFEGAVRALQSRTEELSFFYNMCPNPKRVEQIHFTEMRERIDQLEKAIKLRNYRGE